MSCHSLLDFSTKNTKIKDVLGDDIMYTKLLKSITSLSLIGGALLYTNGSDVKVAEAGVFLMCRHRIGRILRLKI